MCNSTTNSQLLTTYEGLYGKGKEEEEGLGLLKVESVCYYDDADGPSAIICPYDSADTHTHTRAHNGGSRQKKRADGQKLNKKGFFFAVHLRKLLLLVPTNNILYKSILMLK